MRISDWSSDVCSSDLRVDVDLAERNLAGEILGRHHHARDPEEDDVETGDQCRTGQEDLVLFPVRHDVAALVFYRAIGRPAERGERPQCGGEPRSEEHTSELQSLMCISYAVFCLKKKKKKTRNIKKTTIK